MVEIKWDIKRGVGIYRQVFDSRLKSWISTGKIKPGEVVFPVGENPKSSTKLSPIFGAMKKLN